MWFDETLASGMVPYHHIVGGENGMGEDRRWLEPARKYFNWMAKHDVHFVNKRSIANLGVVMGQRTHLFYKPPTGTQMRQYMDGMYYVLLEGRFLFDFVHEEKMGLEELRRYSALVLPNTALLSDEQCRQLRAYVDAGGAEVSEDTVRFWVVLGTLKWGVICAGQALLHVNGVLRSVELAALGRRVAEMEWDLLDLLDGGW